MLHELSKHKSLGVMTVQCEDEISGCASAVGASFAGALAVTSTSGPGICLKSEAMNLAVIMELPLVVLDVQRGGPATGLPTKSEQTDLLQVLFGRNGESPMPVLAATSPTDCFECAYMASKIALEHMTPRRTAYRCFRCQRLGSVETAQACRLSRYRSALCTPRNARFMDTLPAR